MGAFVLLLHVVGWGLLVGVVAPHEYRVGGGFVYSPNDNVSVDLGGGYAIERRFDFHRADIEYKVDGAPYLRLEFKAKF